MAEPIVAPSRVKADLRYLHPDFRRPGMVLRCNAERAEDVDSSAEGVVARVEQELALAADRYRRILGVGIALLLLPVVLAAASWRLLFLLPPDVYEPYVRGAHVSYVSLYEAIAFVGLFLLLFAGAVVSYRSIQAMYRLNPDYRFLRDADERSRRIVAEEVSSGRWPRTRALLLYARQFAAYRPLLAESDRTPEPPMAPTGAELRTGSAEEPPSGDGDAEPEEPPLTAMSWGVSRAAAVTLLSTAVILLGGLGAAWVAVQDWSDIAIALGMGAALIGGYLLMIGVVWGVARAAGYSLHDAVGLRWPAVLPTLTLALAVAVGARFLAGAWAVLLEALGVDVSRSGVDPTTLLPGGPLGIALTVLAVCVLAPFAEEVVFRGVLLSALRERWGDGVAIGVSSAVFASVHVLPVAMLPIFVLALLLGRLYVRSRTLWLPIATHALFNGIGLAALYLLKAFGTA